MKLMDQFPARLQKILDQEYPAFSAEEYSRRRRAFEAAMEKHGVDYVLIQGAFWVGGAVQWLTGWQSSYEALVILKIGETPKLLVNHYNHVPLAQRMAPRTDVSWSGPSIVETALKELTRLGGSGARLGIVGLFSTPQHELLNGYAKELVDMGGDYIRLRQIKSDEELDWLRIGAAFSDRAVAAIPENLKLGMTEHELGKAVQDAYLGLGGRDVIHFFMVNDMANPEYCVPRQYTSNRPIQKGDALTTEMSAHFWDHPGQVLRTFTIGADPTALYKDLHDTAMAAFDAIVGVLKHGTTPAEVIEAAAVIEDAGFTIWDDLTHGYGGGYLPPVLGSKSRMNAPLPDMIFEAGMTVVVQPNVVSLDYKAGVQTGELLLITNTGTERMHSFPPGLQRIDP